MPGSSKNSLTFIAVAIIFGGAILYGIYLYQGASRDGASPAGGSPTNDIADGGAAFDPRNATYDIEGQSITLVDGWGESASDPGVVTTILTRYFGNEARGDIDGDGREDIAFLLTQESGGSGIFYYAAAALNKPEGYQTTGVFFIGDRIAPQTTEIRDGAILVNYGDRRDGEPMTAEPTMMITETLYVSPSGQLID